MKASNITGFLKFCVWYLHLSQILSQNNNYNFYNLEMNFFQAKSNSAFYWGQNSLWQVTFKLSCKSDINLHMNYWGFSLWLLILLKNISLTTIRYSLIKTCIPNTVTEYLLNMIPWIVLAKNTCNILTCFQKPFYKKSFQSGMALYISHTGMHHSSEG